MVTTLKLLLCAVKLKEAAFSQYIIFDVLKRIFKTLVGGVNGKEI